ncbi:hypothetical protein Nepgr_001847 [Nepenthes gracilis]|uniref:Uncharacterized protein n=1 Tax=Nepenthes gracilis TaxID=150966 RepID=A0AAD3P7X2_NEPGR|nr:hypothetical protein Nepgr_001847 [Nepenthes gracilis]
MSLSSCCAALAIYATERREHGSPSTDNSGKERVDESSASMDIIARIKGMAFTVRMKEHDPNDNGEIKNMRQDWNYAPEFDGIHCFETIVHV